MRDRKSNAVGMPFGGCSLFIRRFLFGHPSCDANVRLKAENAEWHPSTADATPECEDIQRV